MILLNEHWTNRLKCILHINKQITVIKEKNDQNIIVFFVVMTFQNARFYWFVLHSSFRQIYITKQLIFPNDFVCLDLACVTDNAQMCAIIEYKVWLSHQMLSVCWNSHSRQHCRYKEQSFKDNLNSISFNFVYTLLYRTIRNKMKDLVNGNLLIQNNNEQNHAHNNGAVYGDR